jgi:hypothetical protein
LCTALAAEPPARTLAHAATLARAPRCRRSHGPHLCLCLCCRCPCCRSTTAALPPPPRCPLPTLRWQRPLPPCSCWRSRP